MEGNPEDSRLQRKWKEKMAGNVSQNIPGLADESVSDADDLADHGLIVLVRNDWFCDVVVLNMSNWFEILCPYSCFLSATAAHCR